VDAAVVDRADGDEVVGVGAAAVAAPGDVMSEQLAALVAAGHRAAVAVPCQHQPSPRLWSGEVTLLERHLGHVQGRDHVLALGAGALGVLTVGVLAPALLLGDRRIVDPGDLLDLLEVLPRGRHEALLGGDRALPAAAAHHVHQLGPVAHRDPRGSTIRTRIAGAT
jgi:hypothetical protein